MKRLLAIKLLQLAFSLEPLLAVAMEQSAVESYAKRQMEALAEAQAKMLEHQQNVAQIARDN